MTAKRGQQHVVVIYDIPDDGKRLKVSEACLDYGLDRIQYSAFQGLLSRGLQKELMTRVRVTLGKAPGYIQLIPIGQEEWRQRLEVLQEAKENA